MATTSSTSRSNKWFHAPKLGGGAQRFINQFSEFLGVRGTDLDGTDGNASVIVVISIIGSILHYSRRNCSSSN